VKLNGGRKMNKGTHDIDKKKPQNSTEDDEIRSDYVKKQVVGKKYLPWLASKLRDFILIEKIALNKYHGYSLGPVRKYLYDRYPDHYKEIFKELNPKEYKLILKKEKLDKELEEKDKKNSVSQSNEDLKFWKKHGGVI
jgi:hypothetical protein